MRPSSQERSSSDFLLTCHDSGLFPPILKITYSEKPEVHLSVTDLTGLKKEIINFTNPLRLSQCVGW